MRGTCPELEHEYKGLQRNLFGISSCVNIFSSLIVLFHGGIVDLDGKPRSIFFHYTIFVRIFVEPLVYRALHMFTVLSFRFFF